LLALAATPSGSARTQGTPELLRAGPLRIEVHVSRTATLFHVVDQLSAWSPFCHGQYARGLEPLDEEDRAALARHRSVRARHPWGSGLERSFYTSLELDAAVGEAVARGDITAEEGDMELEVLEHFAERVARLSAAESGRLLGFARRIHEELPAMTEFAERLQRLVGRAPDTVPVFLVPNPADQDFGGGFNGGRLTLEVPRVADAWPTFLHEIFHAFLETRRADMERVVDAAATPGRALDFQTLDEGLAHALSPGLLHAGPPDSDPLVERVRELDRARRGLDDYEGRVYRFALALRPLVREALGPAEDASAAAARTAPEDPLGDLLPRAVDVWKALVELELAEARAAASSGR